MFDGRRRPRAGRLHVVRQRRRPRRPRRPLRRALRPRRAAGTGRAPGQRGQRGADVGVTLKLSFEDSLNGLTTKIPVELETACSTCKGSGAEPGTKPVICPECRGRGVTSEDEGFFAFSRPCPRCRGNGTVIEKPCRTCHGSGRERRTKRYTVKIPAGVKDGTQIRLKGKGEAGLRRRPGRRPDRDDRAWRPRRSSSAAAPTSSSRSP